MKAAKTAMVIGMVVGGGRIGAAFAQSPRLTPPRELTSINGIRARLKRPSLSHVRPPRARRGYRAGVDVSGISKPLVHLNVLVRARAFEPEIARAADRYGIDPRLLWCVAFNESRFAPHDAQGRTRMSSKGAAGLMQFIPATAARFRINPLDDRQAIHGAALYLRNLLDRYRGDTQAALAAYNAGEGAVDAFRYGITVNRSGAAPINRARLRTVDGLPPYRETRNYVRQAQILWQSIEWASRFTPAQLARTTATFGRATVAANVSGPSTSPPTATTVVVSPSLTETRPATYQATVRKTMFQLPSAGESFNVPRSVIAGRASRSVHDDEEDAVSLTALNNLSGGAVTKAAASRTNTPLRTATQQQEAGEPHIDLFSGERFIVHAPRTKNQPHKQVPQNTTHKSAIAK